MQILLFNACGCCQKVRFTKNQDSNLFRKNKSFQIHGSEWLTVCFSGMITGPLAYIFAGVVVSTISHGIDLNADIKEDSDDYRKIRPLYIVQLVVIISLLVLSPINYFVAKATVREEHDHHEEEDEIDYTAYKPVEWKIDQEKPKVFDYADEFFFKPIFIRSYHNRKKCLGVIKHAFELSALLYEHSHDDHDDHDDHGHGDHDSHGSSHGHGHSKDHHHEEPHHSSSEDEEEQNHTEVASIPLDMTLDQNPEVELAKPTQGPTPKPKSKPESKKSEKRKKILPKLKPFKSTNLKANDLSQDLIDEMDMTLQQTEKSDSESSEY